MMDCCNWSLPWGGTNQQEPFLFVVDPAGTICAYGSKTKQGETCVVVNFPRVSTNHISPYTITVAINDNGSVFPTDSKQTSLLTIWYHLDAHQINCDKQVKAISDHFRITSHLLSVRSNKKGGKEMSHHMFVQTEVYSMMSSQEQPKSSQFSHQLAMTFINPELPLH